MVQYDVIEEQLEQRGIAGRWTTGSVRCRSVVPSLSAFDDEEKGKRKRKKGKKRKEKNGLLDAQAPHKQVAGGNRLSRASEVLI